MQAYFASDSANASVPFLAPPSMSSSRIPALRVDEDIDDFLSSDLEISFASNMSLQSPEKRGHEDSDVMMDISPAPPVRTSTSENVDITGRKLAGRPRSATTSAARLFGRDAGNDPPPVSALHPPSTRLSNKRIQRSALPMEWMSQTKPSSGLVAPSSPDAMDVDSSFSQSLDRPFVDLSSPAQVPLSAAPTVSGFDSFSPPPPPLSAAPTIKGFDTFFDVVSPERSHDDIAAHPAKKRRSVSPPTSGRRRSGTVGALDSSPIGPSSPSALKLERILSNGASRVGKPMLAGLGNPDATASSNKRPRRPMISSMIAQPPSIRSAYPILDGRDECEQRPQPAPTRRAFSAMLPHGGIDLSLSSESSFDNSGDMSSPAAAHAKRQQTRTLRRIDGTDDFRATGSLRMYDEQKRESPRARAMPEWGFGLGGFGDNEAAGKILPCHRVREDGLMRIKSAALDDLLDGKYNSQIDSFQVVDCRFDYEYNGGHVPGAININTTQALEEYFLGPHMDKPIASTSGVGAKKKILVFHCEFSVKRAPTFAKYLRSKDRSMNGHNYPKVFYPEIYVLEGGYCGYFKESRARIRPTGYVRMDDPHHAASRKEDLDQFRKGKFGRTRSYAYGDAMLGGTSSKVIKRSSAPTGGSHNLFAAAGNAARIRRSGLDTLAEDRSQATDDEETDIGDSPCPPPTKSAVFKGKRLGGLGRAAPLLRAETYDPSRFAGY
ncbi:hypothetical protein K488DRAFT_79028 [Vararia minispora EC-137]|uniref:Uncharacterized protein n=1 Tax=Vararia minispora EC-137 TaxID=1314806 RepID=A0ACB8QIL5_9AGAM|nr:hypothetical protein K488DRAFT_79028 [Vararia minispora EC-137]